MSKTDATQSMTMSPDELLKRLRAGSRDTFVIRLREAEIPVRILTVNEWNAIRREALTDTMLIKGDDVDKNVAIQKKVLALATTMPGQIPILGPKVWDRLYLDEVNSLYDEYTKCCEDVNPAIERLDDGQFKALVEAAKKKSISASDCSLPQLRAIFSDWQAMILKQESPS